MIELNGAKVYMMQPGEGFQVKKKSIGFYVYRDMMARTVIEDIICKGEGDTVNVAGSEAVKPFMLVLWEEPEEKKKAPEKKAPVRKTKSKRK
jgi:hypothetical protein